MKKVVLNAIAAVLMVLGLAGISTVSPAYAKPLCPNGQPSSTDDLSGCTEYSGSTLQKNNLMGTMNTIINVIVGVVGFISVAMIVLGGISFATSQGDTAKTTKARNTILYGVVGLVVALLAFAIVNFVLSSVFNSATATV